MHQFITWRIWKLSLSKFLAKFCFQAPLSVTNFVFLDASASLILIIPKNVLGPCHPQGPIAPNLNLIFLFGQIHTFNSDSVFSPKLAFKTVSKKWPHVIPRISWTTLWSNTFLKPWAMMLTHRFCINAVHLHVQAASHVKPMPVTTSGSRTNVSHLRIELMYF